MTFASRPARRALSLLLVAAVAWPVAATTAAADVDEPPTLEPVPATAAQQALRQAQVLLADHAPATSQGIDATLALRDLAVALPDLERADRRTARALLARPNGGRQSYDQGATWEGPEAPESAAGGGCSATIDLCVHWTSSGVDAPPATDTDGDNVPDQVEETLAVMEQVWGDIVDDMGFRRPLYDGRASHDDADPGFDVYLSDIGDHSLYGYCAPDDSRMNAGSSYKFYDLAAYCVLDEDYVEFPSNTPEENLQVTAAHEFFHAVQFAYDALEDAWLMEGSAAWIEDELFDNVNDNRQYLGASQFNRPRRPLDVSNGLSVYGSWGFWRYLTERFGQGLMLATWKRADGSLVGPDDYSVRALRRVLAVRGSDLTSVLGDFGLVIAAPGRFLDEGAHFPSALIDSFRLARSGATTGWRRFTLDHLAYAPLRFVPGDRLADDARLTITLDLPASGASPVARLLVVRADGSTSAIRRVPLDRTGAGTVRLGFSPDAVRRVLLTVGNASSQFGACYTDSTQFSCAGGIPRHDNLPFEVRATVH